MDISNQRTVTKDMGVYTRTSATRRHNGKPDVCYDITYKDSKGRKIWEKVGWRSEGITQAVAVGKRRERMEALRLGAPIDRASRIITFGDAYLEWKNTHLSTLKGQVSIKAMAEKHVLPRFKMRSMNAINALDLERMKAEMLAAGLSTQTVKHALSFVRRVYNKAILWGIYTGTVPTLGITMPKPDNARMRYLTREEAQLLMKTLHKISLLWHDIAMLSLHTGMRVSDILGLKCRQIDFHSSIIDVLESKPGTYTAYLTDDAARMLQGRVGNDPNALVFPSPRGGGQMEKAGKPFLRAVELCSLNQSAPDIRYRVVFHTLRHTYASWLAQSGVSLAVIAAPMGHATLKMTQRYAKLSPDNKKGAANIVARLLHT